MQSTLLQSNVLVHTEQGPKLQLISSVLPWSKPHFEKGNVWVEMLLQSIKLGLLYTDWVKAQEPNPNLQNSSKDKKLGKMVQPSLSELTLQCTKANSSLAKLSNIIIHRSSSSCYLVWEISGIRTKFSLSKNETEEGDWPNCWKKEAKIAIHPAFACVANRRHHSLQGTK